MDPTLHEASPQNAVVYWPNVPHLFRLSFIRPPPISVAFDQDFDVVIAVADDLGDSACGWEELEVAFTTVDASRPLSVLVNGRASVSIAERNGAHHRLKLRVHTDQALEATFRLRMEAKTVRSSTIPHSALAPFLEFLNEKPEACHCSADANYVVMPLETSDLHVGSTAPAKASKVQSFRRHFFLGEAATMTIVETPHASSGLGIGGSHLWDSALVLAYVLVPLISARRFMNPLRVVELGAGCGLVSIVAAAMSKVTSVIATDLAETVYGSLAENLALNPPQNSKISSMALEWGSAIPDDLAAGDGEDLMVVASDVLYNPSSHEAFLETVEALLRSAVGDSELVLAYRPRTEGDDTFFSMARGRGLSAKMIARIGVVTVWSIR